MAKSIHNLPSSNKLIEKIRYDIVHNRRRKQFDEDLIFNLENDDDCLIIPVQNLLEITQNEIIHAIISCPALKSILLLFTDRKLEELLKYVR